MSGFELRAKFYPRVPTLAQLIEEAQEGVDYPFAVHQILQLRPKDYSKLCRDFDKEYGFERMLPEEGYDPVYTAFPALQKTWSAAPHFAAVSAQSVRVHTTEIDLRYDLYRHGLDNVLIGGFSTHD